MMDGHDAENTHEPRPGEVVELPQGGADYAAAGAAFTAWFNGRVRRLTNPTVMLGTKLARVVELHRDGRLECEVETEALEPERQFVAFEASYLDQLVRKIAAIGL